MSESILVEYKENLRINPENSYEIQCKSTSMGAAWRHRYTSIEEGKFLSLESFGHCIEAKTENGDFQSYDGGRNWTRCLDE
jgi:hypothetical protein